MFSCFRQYRYEQVIHVQVKRNTDMMLTLLLLFCAILGKFVADVCGFISMHVYIMKCQVIISGLCLAPIYL